MTKYAPKAGLDVSLDGHRKQLTVSINSVFLYVGPATDEGYHAASQAFQEHLRGVVAELRDEP